MDEPQLLASTVPAKALPRERDLRLDLFRGLTMIIIFVAHVPNNPWADWIPARFGFSSGAETFVFCSGIACGIAFGGTFVRKGFLAGVTRIAKRIAQLYAAHVLLFLALAGTMILLDRAWGVTTHVERYRLDYLVADPDGALSALLSLRFIPQFFDILPLYMMLLALVPIAMLVASRSVALAATISIGAWLALQIWPLHLSAHPLNETVWYFNPIGWQLLFFTGFAFAMTWISPPRLRDPWLVAIAVAVVVISIPLNHAPLRDGWAAAEAVLSAIYPPDAITTLHPLRAVHFLAVAYLCLSAIEPWRHRLGSAALAPVVLIGQQSLVTFLTGLALSYAAGIALDAVGRDAGSAAAVNAAGIVVLIAAAQIARSLKARSTVGTPAIGQPARERDHVVPDNRPKERAA